MKNLTNLILIILVNFLFSIHANSTPINQFINTVSPALNANSIVKSSDIVISFEQIMNGSTMTSANVKVFGYQTGLLTTSLDFNSVANTLTINPVNEFKNGEIISVTLTAGVKTISNQSITPFVYKFRAKALGGTGSFILASEINNTTYGNIRSGDLDGDGDLDLVINNGIYKNNGNALFNLSSTLNNQGWPEIFDADNDNDLDILLTYDSTIYYYKNDGLGNFSLFSTFAGSVWGYGDLTGNGFLDFAYFVNASEVKTAFNNNGIFNQAQSYSLSGLCFTSANYTDNLLFNDFNNDGSIDIMSISGYAGGNSITGYDLCKSFNQLTNIGTGNFTVQTIFDSFNGGGPYIFSAGDSKSFDFDGDGFIDITSPFLKLKNNDNTTYSDAGYLFPFSNSLDFDANGDEFIDICVNYYGVFSCYINNGIGDFTPSFIIQKPSWGSKAASGDFDNDGDIDMAIIYYDDTKVLILLNGDSPLPVELSSYTSSINQNSVKLNWSTSQEQNNSGFEIQRADKFTEGQKVWKKIDFINGAGNSNDEKNYSYDDKNLTSGKYKYRLKQIDFNGNFEYHELSNEVVIGIPSSTELMQNYPNPFNPVTNISYRLSENGFVTLRIFDNTGREVKTLVNEFRQAGYYNEIFNGSDLASGVYFYKLTTGDFVQTKKLSLLK
ncbi:MAG TPA: FG-GAP-like repeat-containing protein [Ignavibacteria bacterium]|nr:FG-GAP-like repeat-containing protein [Ignavibacteria bacterium]